MVYQTRTYGIWCGIKQRCLNPKNKRYSSYGGRGIDVDPRWAASFIAFLEDMGHAPDGMSIDRIDNDKGYWRGNCRWATAQEQQSNMRTSRFITARGRTLTLNEWARELDVDATSIFYRIKKGMSEEEAITTPFIRKQWKKSAARCLRCAHEWETRVAKPRTCPNCKMNPQKKPHHVWSEEARERRWGSK